jgi:hypothetical protein
LTEHSRPFLLPHLCQIGTNLGKWDNGLYVTGLIQEVPVHVLWVDSGSTSTFISYNVFMRFWCKPTLNISNSVIKDVNGEHLKVYGTVQIKINFEKETFEHSVIICQPCQQFYYF